MTRNPCTEKNCKERGCCLNCTEYGGSLEFIPTVLNVSCRKREGVVLRLHGYPKINGKADKNCKHWKFYTGKKETKNGQKEKTNNRNES